MSAGIWINEVDLGDLGFALSVGTQGHADAPELTAVEVTTAAWPGPMFAAEPTVATSRRLTIAGNLRQSTLALLVAAEDALKALAEDGAVRIRFRDRLDQEFRDARCTKCAIQRRGALFGVSADVVLEFALALPVRVRREPDGYALSSVRTPCPIGTAPSAPVLIVHGGGASLTNPTVTVRNAAGDVVQTMGFTVTLGATEYLRIDSARGFVTRVAAGAPTDGASTYASGDFPLLRPSDAWAAFSAWPTIELGAASGTPLGTILYSRHYL